MRQALLLPAAPLLAVTLLVPPTLAQETTGRMEGRVLDANGQPIADVNVSVTSLVTARPRLEPVRIAATMTIERAEFEFHGADSGLRAGERPQIGSSLREVEGPSAIYTRSQLSTGSICGLAQLSPRAQSEPAITFRASCKNSVACSIMVRASSAVITASTP